MPFRLNFEKDNPRHLLIIFSSKRECHQAVHHIDIYFLWNINFIDVQLVDMLITEYCIFLAHFLICLNADVCTALQNFTVCNFLWHS